MEIRARVNSFLHRVNSDPGQYQSKYQSDDYLARTINPQSRKICNVKITQLIAQGVDPDHLSVIHRTTSSQNDVGQLRRT